MARKFNINSDEQGKFRDAPGAGETKVAVIPENDPSNPMFVSDVWDGDQDHIIIAVGTSEVEAKVGVSRLAIGKD